MKNLLMLLGVFASGIALGVFELIPVDFAYDDLATIVLYILIIQIGLGLGASGKLAAIIRAVNLKILMLPVCTIAGTLLFTVLVGALFTDYAMADWLAVGSGLGYYSLSSILILEIKGTPDLATIAILTNMIREVLALFLIPVLVRYVNRYSAIAAAGVTSLDVALPMLGRYAGADMIPVALVHGIVLEVAVPLLVTFFCSI